MKVMLATKSSRSNNMGYFEISHFIKVSLIRGYAFFGFAVLCFMVLIVLVIVYGDVGSYEIDPDNPNIMRGHKHDMHKDTFARYYLISKTIAGICGLSSIVGVILYGLWKSQTRPY